MQDILYIFLKDTFVEYYNGESQQTPVT